MINTIKSWIEQIKSSSITKPFIATKNWLHENVIKRKLIIFGLLFTTWLSLLLGAIYSPQRQTYSDEQLKTKQSFSNGTGEIKLTSQTYSAKTGIIVLQFETKDATSSVDRGIDTKRLKWQLYAQHKTADTVMEVVPIIDNKISVIIRNVPEDFGAYAIDITNKTVATSSIDVDIDDSSDDDDTTTSSPTSTDDEEANVVQFMITTQNSQLKKETIKAVSREEFTLSEIKKEEAFQNNQIKKLNTSIAQLKVSIEDDESRKASLSTESQYLTGDDLEANQKDIASIDSNIETKNRSIETANTNIEKLEEKLEALAKKKAAVKDGTFVFSNPIETIEMK
ncbi:hypothetical protein OIY87_00725 [Streptococcus gallolyticus]|uniref:hypothetical protein n=1 Tax=Streptococcus gallolyticus TaxID=315405 RepID=UPI0022B681BC|nr:hypothetical protein [Streptococcus gallolyticus]WAW97909.1 hypothetical protein OIY87_07220 [Streptococcus gallolyticus]WAW98953.1 hypothetical protein OIY87_00725 [Streptococcus gallolyticus]